MGQVLTGVDEAVAILDRGGVVVIPTETVYGIAARPDAAGVARIFEVKGRPSDKSLQLLVDDASLLEVLARPSEAAKALARAFWPGPLTLVVPANDAAPQAVRTNDTIGLRQPAHPVALELLARTGPLAASSANRSGEHAATTIEGIHDVFGDLVDGYVDGGYIDESASTVVALIDDEPTFLRVGVLSEAAVKSALGRSI